MIITFLVIFLLITALFFLSKGKYDEYILPLDKKLYPFKEFFPIPLYILEKINYMYDTAYDRKLMVKLAEISGHKYSQYYLRVHWASKITYVLLGLFFATLVGCSQEISLGLIAVALMLLTLLFFLPDSQLNDKVKRRHLEIQIDFPDFLNKLTLLINAGMTISHAWVKIVEDNEKNRPLYDEVAIVIAEIRAGKPEVQAYEDFAKRCRMSEISRFVSVIVQNLRKGSNELVSILRLQANDCWELRKHAAKRLGEEASTKLLFPMMIMFIAILIIVAVPALLSLQGI